MIQDSFWSNDYLTGVDTLIDALKVSIAENKQFLTMVQERAKIENGVAAGLAQLSQEPVMHAIPIQSGSFVPKSSSLQSALSTFTAETVNQAVMHTRIASDLDKKVRIPLQKWCGMYAKRIESCSSRLHKLVFEYKSLYQQVIKQRVVYYEQCHKYEDATNGGSPRDPIIKTIRLLRDSLKVTESNTIPTSTPKNKIDFRIAGLTYTRQALADLMKIILQDITFTEYKVPLLGSYENVTTGSMLATATRKHLKNDSFAYAEKFGQSLVDQGFIKPLGQISNRFQTSHNTYYQIQSSIFELANESSDESDTDSVASTTRSVPGSSGSIDSQGHLAATDVSEEHYLQAILELDSFRCSMETEIMQIYQFLDQLEQDREDAIKKGMQDYIAVVFKTKELLQMQENMAVVQQKVNPAADLANMVGKNKVGPYLPNVTVFEGYFENNVVQTFGVDLPRSRFFVDVVLDWLKSADTNEPSEINFWTKSESIGDIFMLRTQINTGKPFSADAIFRFFSKRTVISTFLQYLLELPESVVSFMIYERIKQIYSISSGIPEPSEVVAALIQMSQESRYVLRQIITYLRSQFDVTVYEDLAQSLAFPLVRPRAPSAVTMDDIHPKLLICDLLNRGPELFEMLDIKQKEIIALRDTPSPKLVRNACPESPSPKPVSHSSTSSGNVGMRPLSMNLHHQSKYTSALQGASELSSPRGVRIKPILPLLQSEEGSSRVTSSVSNSFNIGASPNGGISNISISNLSVGSTNSEISPVSSPNTSKERSRSPPVFPKILKL